MNKKMIKAIIVDDEQHNRNVLQTLLETHCPLVKITGTAGDADSGYNLIKENEPQLVFIDIKMPKKSGFDLLRMFDSIGFEVIFVSAFDKYALTAFEFNALDYILKPVDYTKLVKAVDKAITKIENAQYRNSLLQIADTLDEETNVVNKFMLHHNDKVVFVHVAEVVYIEAHSDVCLLYLQNEKKYSSSKDLKLYEDILLPTHHFLRINKSILINTNRVKSYTKGEACFIELDNGKDFEVSRRKKAEIIKQLDNRVLR